MRLPETIEHLPVGELVPYARNSRTHSDQQVAQLAASIREFGFTNPVLIGEDGTIVAGHGRVMAARQLGLERVPCIRLGHLSEAQRRAYVIADNKLALNAGWDESVLAEELRQIMGDGFGLDAVGFSDSELGELLARVDMPVAAPADPDEAPSKAAVAIARPGDVWRLGRHAVLCGDSTVRESYARVLAGGGLADVVWTDPPYNVAYETGAGKIANDNLSADGFRAFLTAAFASLHAALKPGASIYIAHADTEGLAFRSAFAGAGFKLSGVLIWKKDALVLGRSDYQWIHEPILYGWKQGAAHKWYGGRKLTTVSEVGTSGSPFVKRQDGRWQVSIGEETLIVGPDAACEFVEDSIIRELRPRRSDVHPTMKPVALIERMLRNSAKPGACVLDPFGGSGSTLIAAERLGMNARLIELDPAYVDVIVRRWQEFTGSDATLEGDGRTFDEIESRR